MPKHWYHPLYGQVLHELVCSARATEKAVVAGPESEQRKPSAAYSSVCVTCSILSGRLELLHQLPQTQQQIASRYCEMREVRCEWLTECKDKHRGLEQAREYKQNELKPFDNLS